MIVVETKREVRRELLKARSAVKQIGLVATMGNLHAGHIALLETARQHSNFIVSTIFVNPLQFGEDEDLAAYPRTLAEDLKKLESAGCDLVFTPDVAEMYDNQANSETLVHVPAVSENFCGKSRPGHFDGVATIVAKLFHIIWPDQAYFGLKDYQQFLVIKKMVSDLAMPIDVIGVPIKREESGLAMSSRNNYLSAENRTQAAMLSQAIAHVKTQLLQGERDFSALEKSGTKLIEQAGMQTDYFAICSAADLSLARIEHRELIVLAAAYLDKTRLIDNMQVTL